MEGKTEVDSEYVRFCPLRENVRRLSCHAEISGVWFGDDWWGRRSKWSAALRASRLTWLLDADLKVWNTGGSSGFPCVIRLRSSTLFSVSLAWAFISFRCWINLDLSIKISRCQWFPTIFRLKKKIRSSRAIVKYISMRWIIRSCGNLFMAIYSISIGIWLII